MSDMMGHNLPVIELPEPEAVTARLTADMADEMKRASDLLERFKDKPKEVDSDDAAANLTDFSTQMRLCIKTLKDARANKKAGWLAGGRAVDGFFNATIDHLEAARKTVGKVVDNFVQEKAEKERRRREAEAEKARLAALEAQRKAEEENARLRAKQEEAEERARVAEAKAKDAERRADEASKAAAEKERQLETKAQADAVIDRRAADRDAKTAQARATDAAKAADAKPSQMAKVRGHHGGVASPEAYWTFWIEQYEWIDLEALREHLNRDAVEAAVAKYVKAGGRTLRGVKIYEAKRTAMR